MPTPEGKVKSEVSKALAVLETAGLVLWYERMNSLAIHQQGIHINGCRKGMTDFVAVFIAKHGGIGFAFIECKRADIKAKWIGTQLEFKTKYEGRHADIHFWLVQSSRDVKSLILEHCYNRIADMELDV